jgi:hypothetical protein
MQEPTRALADEVRQRLATLNAHLGGLVVEHARLLLRYEELAGRSEPDNDPVDDPHGCEQQEHGEGPLVASDALARQDRVDRVRFMRQAMQRALYVVDFTLVHRRIDPTMLHDARRALVDGVDAADATLQIEGADDDR